MQSDLDANDNLEGSVEVHVGHPNPQSSIPDGHQDDHQEINVSPPPTGIVNIHTLGNVTAKQNSRFVQINDNPQPAPPEYIEEGDEWESGMRRTYNALGSGNIDVSSKEMTRAKLGLMECLYQKLDIPQHRPRSLAEASALVGKGYQIAQQSRALYFWAHRQLSNAEKNLTFCARRLEAAERQVKQIVDVVEGGLQFRVIQAEPQGVPIMPYVVEQDEG